MANLELCKSLADTGLASGQFNYALALEDGDGIAVDLKKAADYYKRAADQGHAKAQCNYGNMLSTGRGVSRDLKEAARYFKMAADQKNPAGLCNYGCCLETGSGVEANTTEALDYYKRASEAGVTEAKQNYDRLKAKVDAKGEAAEEDNAVPDGLIDATPVSWKNVMKIVHRINEKFTSMNFLTKQKETPIKNLKSVWAFNPKDIESAISAFVENDGIPPKSKDFQKLFFEEFDEARNALMDEIIDAYMQIKRKSDSFDEFRDAPIEIDEEIEKWDSRATLMMRGFPEWVEVLKELKTAVARWYSKANCAEIYKDEFQPVITASLKKFLASSKGAAYKK